MYVGYVLLMRVWHGGDETIIPSRSLCSLCAMRVWHGSEESSAVKSSLCSCRRECDEQILTYSATAVHPFCGVSWPGTTLLLFADPVGGDGRGYRRWCLRVLSSRRCRTPALHRSICMCGRTHLPGAHRKSFNCVSALLVLFSTGTSFVTPESPVRH